jgi:hypothetical protein
MNLKVTQRLVDEKLDFLHRHPRISRKPTAEPVYALPKAIHRRVIDSNFSQTSLQNLSDNIGYFLGLLHSVKVTIGIESSEYMLADTATMDEAEKLGLYKVRGGAQREIQLTKKFRFKFKHVLAILVHESMHNFLDNHGVRLDDTDQNEILTDISTAYFGLGQPVMKGYQPVVWTSDHWLRRNEYGYTTHTYTIGYVPASLIGYAVYRTAVIRNLPEFRKICPLRFRIPLHFKLRREERRAAEASRKLKGFIGRIDRAKQDFDNLADVLQSPGDHHWKNIKGENSSLLVELNGLVVTGEIERALQSIQTRAHAIAQNGDIEILENLHTEASSLCERIDKWKAALNIALID